MRVAMRKTVPMSYGGCQPQSSSVNETDATNYM